MIPVIKWEFKQRKTSLFWWCFAVALTIAAVMLIYPSIRDQAKEFNQVINQLPDSLKGFKTGSSSVDIASPNGWLNSQIFYSTLPFIISVFSITLGRSLASSEERKRTLELILARPITRTKLLLAKSLTYWLMMAIMGLVVGVTVLIFAWLISMNVNAANVWLTTLFTMLLLASFGLVTFACGAAGSWLRKIGLPLALILSFGSYMLTSLSSMTDTLAKVSKALPYHYFDPTHLLEGRLSRGLCLYLVGILVVTSVVAWQGFRTRDID